MKPADIDYQGFSEKEPGTIILDTRSKAAYEARHIKGAVHLNFSEFTEEKLKKVIPSKDTKVLIYCNNNFIGDPMWMARKAAPLALNIPTFINLYGYGYKNIFELGNLLVVGGSADQKVGLEFEGSAVSPN